jgi:hypothetical protein
MLSAGSRHDRVVAGGPIRRTLGYIVYDLRYWASTTARVIVSHARARAITHLPVRARARSHDSLMSSLVLGDLAHLRVELGQS